MIVRAYFVLGGEPGTAGLVPVLRVVPKTAAVATAAMNELLAGPTPAEAGDRTITTADPCRHAPPRPDDQERRRDREPVDRIRLGRRERLDAVPPRPGRLHADPVHTVKSVVFQIEGQTVTVFGSEGIVLDGPVGRADYADQLPSIFVDRPAYGAALATRGRCQRQCRCLRGDLPDRDPRRVRQDARRPAGHGDVWDRLPWHVRRDAPVHGHRRRSGGRSARTTSSAKDGTPEDIRDYPVWLTPAG